MNIVFFGSSQYSVIDAKMLHGSFGLRLVVTVPDQPVGRNKITTPSPVKLFALEKNIPVITTNKLDKSIFDEIKKVDPDFLVVADYGLFLPRSLLELPTYAAINVHHSLLPKYRGPTPAPTAIINGDKITGVTIIKMREKVDAGEILMQEKYEIKQDETTDSLLTTLNEMGGKLVIKVIQNYTHGTVKLLKQDESNATFTKHLTRESGYINLSKLEIGNWKLEIARKIRAYYPWPNVWTILRINNKDVRVKFLPSNMIQVEGKKPMSYKDFLNGYPEMKDWLEKLHLL